MAWCGLLYWAGLGALISKGVGPWGPLWLRTIMAMMRHNGDHISYVLMGDDPLITLTINPEARLEHRAPPSYARLSHLRRHALVNQGVMGSAPRACHTRPGSVSSAGTCQRTCPDILQSRHRHTSPLVSLPTQHPMAMRAMRIHDCPARGEHRHGGWRVFRGCLIDLSKKKRVRTTP